MAVRKPLTNINGRKTELPSTDRLEGAGIIWVGSTRTESSTLIEYISSGIPNQDGAVFFNLTTDGTASGPAIFSQILNISATAEFPAVDGTTLKKAITAYIHNISPNLKVAEARARQDDRVLSNSGKVYIRVVGT